MKNKKSFTLIELLIFMAIFSVLLLVLTDIITSALNVQLETKAVSSVEQDGRYILSRLSYDIHQADCVKQPTLSVPTDHQMQINIGIPTYTYSIVNNNLNLNNGTSNYVLNSYDSTVTQFNVTRISSSPSKLDTLKIGFTLKSKSQSKSGPEIKDYSTTIDLRNHNISCST